MLFAKVADGFKAYFTLVDVSGNLRTGASPSSFTVTVVNPDDTASNSPTVSETSTKPGLYTFTIPTSFFTTHGTGVYPVVIQVVVPAPSAVKDVISHLLRVTDHDLDTIGCNTALIPALL